MLTNRKLLKDTKAIIVKFFKRNMPYSDFAYISFGLFGVISSICTMYSIANTQIQTNVQELLPIYQSMLICSIMFTTYSLWPGMIKKVVISQILWNCALFYLLIFCSSFFLFVSNFSQVQVVIFMMNIITMAVLLTNWLSTFIFITLGIYSGHLFYKYYINIHNLIPEVSANNLILYSFLLSGTAIIIFFKPHHDEIKWSIRKIRHFKDKLYTSHLELEKSQQVKYNFLRNVEHELKTPLSSIITSAEILRDNDKKMNDEARKDMLDIILSSAEKLHYFTKDMIYLTKFIDQKVDLVIENINISEVFIDRINICKKIYGDNNAQDFIIDVKKDVFIECDIEYMKHALDNLIINAIKYCPKGVIEFYLDNDNIQAEIVVKDSGIGIPPNELYEVFNPFTIASNNPNKIAGGRGLGLALSKEVIKKHEGTIKAESDGKNGSIFRAILPLRRDIGLKYNT